MDAVSVANKIEDALQKVCADAVAEGWLNTDGPWTQRIKKYLSVLALENGFHSRPSQKESEWLYDMVWYSRTNDYLKWVPLVLESEWSRTRSKIFEDFDKLLLARTQLRVMVFNQGRTSRVEEVLVILEQRIRAFKDTQPGDHYLLAGLSSETNSFRCRIIVA